jgi:hypothetical protein
MFLEMGFLFRYWKVGKKKQMDTTRMSERWKANLPARRDTLYSYLVPREITQLQALPLAVARVPKIASYPSRPRQAQAPDRRRTEMLKESIRRYDPGSSTFYGLEKANGQRWKGLRDIPPRPPGQSQWEASGEDGQNSIENPMVPKAVIRK